ncbi:MAG: hypothetical protein HYS75_05930 [Nitrosopumilales archaeon]|nr:hypothetical protein [Nitrosopumilales archaeon]
MKTMYILMIGIFILFVVPTCVYGISDLKIATWAPQKATVNNSYISEISLGMKVFDKKSNPYGDLQTRDKVLKNVGAAITLTDPKGRLVLISNGFTDEFGYFAVKEQIHWSWIPGKYIAEMIAWNEKSYDYQLHFVHIENLILESGEPEP